MKPRILLVDDNEDFLDSTKDVLEDEGFQVVTASSGEEAIRKVEKQAFDVVLMDIKMPGLNGVESLIELKKRSPGIRVIMCTAYIVNGLIRQALEEGAYAVLNKPFEMDVLMRTIESSQHDVKSGLILLADHDKELCTRLGGVLGSAGHHVRIAHDGREAMRLAEGQSFDIMLLEMGLPFVNGLELHRLVSTRQPAMLATIIMDSALDVDASVQQELKKQHGLISLTKPLDETQLLDLVGSICAAKRL
ncbi:MAG: response regulator [Desulfomonile tiedjei]|nr:response regulator [Desulfomonile tiedjei]